MGKEKRAGKMESSGAQPLKKCSVKRNSGPDEAHAFLTEGVEGFPPLEKVDTFESMPFQY